MATISFWGGVGTVTGSKYLLETDSAKVLVDCGLFQGLKELRERNWQEPPFDPRELDAVLITHAHVDHTGYLPRIVSQGFRGPIYTSLGTASLLKILLPDCARLQEEDADYRNRHHLTKHNPALPLYDEQDARDTLELIKPISNLGGEIDVAPGIRASFNISGHILGSSLVLVEIEGAGDDGAGRKILFSGDLGHYDQPIIQDPQPPPACDYMLVESTYGNRLHDPGDPKDALAQVINETARRGGTVLIPAFAIGRTQELIYVVRELEDERRIPVLPVRVDSPMAGAATQIYHARKEEHDEEYASILANRRHPLRTQSMLTASSREESKRLNHEKGARIIISASGMMTGGRVLHHARRVLPDPHSTIVFVGFQAEGTTGRRILDGEERVKIMGEFVPVRCQTVRIGGFSAHADWQEILHWLEHIPGNGPRRAFITHGELDAAEAMKGHIEDRFGWQATVPAYGDKYELA
jgi:metallo-beta-lactamase family protein